jgi:hypothetical protein
MSLEIAVDKIVAVLFSDGYWYGVAQGSFAIDSYEFVDGRTDEVLHGGGNSGVCATGFCFQVVGSEAYFSGPLTSIVAVKEAP